MCENKEMISLTQAREIVRRELAGFTLPTEVLPVRQALGRIVIEDQTAQLDLPPFDKSAMDGFAVGGDALEEYTVIETVAAGGMPGKQLAPGTAIKVMTGAPVPKGTAKVIMIEQTCQSNGKIRVLSHAGPTHICPQGEDVRTGDIILHAPAVLGPVEIANLISAGIAQVKVAKPLRVAVLSTGNEIVDSPDRLGPGKIMNSNGPMLECLCRKFSLEVTAAGIVADNRDATVSALREALNQADIVVLSGGVSEGDFDFVTDAITQAGLRIHFNRLAVKPGKPMTFAASGQKAIFGLPGNPVAVYLMFHLFVLYAARLLAGMKSELRYFNFTLGRDFHRRQDDRTAFLPCKLTPDGTLQPVAYHGTAHLRALLDCDGFFIVPQGVKDITAGQKISYLNIKDSFE